MKEFKFRYAQTRDLCEDIGVMIHRYVCRAVRAGREWPLEDISLKANIPLLTIRAIYEGTRPATTIAQIGKIRWACEEVLKEAKHLLDKTDDSHDDTEDEEDRR